MKASASAAVVSALAVLVLAVGAVEDGGAGDGVASGDATLGGNTTLLGDDQRNSTALRGSVVIFPTLQGGGGDGSGSPDDRDDQGITPQGQGQEGEAGRDDDDDEPKPSTTPPPSKPLPPPSKPKPPPPTPPADALNQLWKLWYHPGIKWELRGRDWCVQCSGSAGCIDGTTVVTQHCNPRDTDQRWDFVDAKRSDRSVQIRAHDTDTDLCVTRESMKEYVLRKCAWHPIKGEHRQLFVGFADKQSGDDVDDDDHKFLLQPRRMVRFDRYVTMHHHPKHEDEFYGEELKDASRVRAEKPDTLYWVIEDAPRLYKNDLIIRKKECTSKKPCGKCEGECGTDADCKGKLQCWDRYGGPWRKRIERGLELPWSSVPGCRGVGEWAADYCY